MITIPVLECEHCHGQMLEVQVRELPMPCPACGAPLLAMCKLGLNSDRKMVWQVFPPFPEKVKL